ncbi:P-loop containing nucleoside triphosphate hydrolase [Glarea lozoyensis ATCC 20868]|uniref:p-loop containing nucleoside triphosphate hydrolase n=1 Tax=Glarea lozoyensis (strain ATCC 20868 / MF5171) TaxID=1116229 RepID=S3CW29_GLAL2|nr:P-loop containing nucleoside triphosphate hydrolase [Glarea lozoyensis ATCC 20868]EPE29144.1 P-loop containing nucleoside triphosphate hydrolase [Glarea lozoyensis ATCC 20868]
MSDHPVDEKDVTITSQDQQPNSKPEPTQEKRPISSATASSSDKDVPAKSPEVSSAEQVVEKKTGEDGKDVKNDETDYSSKATRKTEFKHFLRIFLHTTTSDRILLGLAAIAQAGTGTTLPLMNIVFGKFVGQFSGYFIPNSGTTKAEFQDSINTLTLFLVYLFIARWVLGYFSMFVLRVVGLKMSAKIRLEYLQSLFQLPISVIDTMPNGQASNTITTTANVLQVGISEKLGTIVQYLALLITSIIIAFKYNAILTLVTSSSILFLAAVYGIIVPIIIKKTKATEQADEKAASIAGEALGSVRMIIACGAENRIAKKYAGWIEESRKRGLKIGPYQGVQFAPLFFGIFSTMALCFWFGFKLYTSGKIDDISTIVIVLNSVMMTSFAISQTAAPILAVTKSTAAATDFYAVIDAPKPNTSGLKEPEISARNDIELENVTFAYPSRPHIKVVDDLSMQFEAGKITAIVGASGSGKSTIVGLLERWYELDNSTLYKLPDSVVVDEKEKKRKEEEEKLKPKEPEQPAVKLGGKILVGGKNLNSIDLKWWRSQIGLVQQEPFIFNDTIRKNVEFGLIGSEWEDADVETKNRLVEEACKEAFADEYISRLPLGYETQVGDSGIKLSGGQRQRLAIARSIIKRPKILILDEATSAIDVRGEKLVQQALDRVAQGRTTITIAHRLSTIKKADKIVVLRKGKVIETGTHDSLLSDENGAYWALVNAQKLTMGDRFESENELTDHKDEELVLSKEMSRASGIETVEKVEWKNKGFFKSFGVLVVEQKQRWRWYLVLSAGCAGAASANSLQAWFFSKLLTVVTIVDGTLQATVNHWSLLFFILGIGSGISYFLLGYSSNQISVHIASTYRQEYFESILDKPVTFFDDEANSSGSLTSRVSNDPTQLQQLLGINMAMVLTLLAVFVIMPITLTCAYFRLKFEIQFESLNQAVFAESSKFAAESINAFRTVSSLTLEDMIAKRYEMLLRQHVGAAFKKSRFTTMVFAFSDSTNLLLMALIFWYGGGLLAKYEYNPVQFFVIYIAVVNGSESSGSLLSFGPNMAQAAQAANRILSFRIRADNKKGAGFDVKSAEGGVKIELKDVWFRYPTRDVGIFQGLNLTIQKGQFAALVGPSGCGKTSIVSLLEQFYPIQRGKILCNGLDIASLDTRAYRKMISLVAQEPTLFQGTIKENILLGVPEDTSQELLERACRDAEIHDFIMSLPEGYATDVGNRGVALSGGQKQRISIARALIRDPKILLLDEATSSLDSESEKLVQAAFERAGVGRTMVVVAHRLATVQRADVIFVLGEGRVLEQGSHKELVGRRGVYWEMCQSQALDR